jgi:hypothetical protein
MHFLVGANLLILLDYSLLDCETVSEKVSLTSSGFTDKKAILYSGTLETTFKITPRHKVLFCPPLVIA